MPYKLRKAPKRDLYWVVTSETGKKHSKDPIPKDKAKAQLRILKKALRGGADDGDDAEIAALMAGLNVQEPVQFAPPPLHHAALAANLFEQPPRPPRRKRGVKRAISTVQGTIYENAPKKQKTGKGRKMKGGRLSETWPMLKAHLDEATGKKEFILLPTNQQKSYLIEQMKGAILEMIPLIDEPQEKKELSTRGITYIGRIMSGTFISDVDQEQELKEGLAEVARKPIHEIIGAPTIEDIPAFRRLHVSQHPRFGGPSAATNPTDQKYYYKQSFTNEPYPTEESVELEPTSRDQMLTRLLAINQDTGKYYDDLIRAGVEEALTPKQAEEKRKREEELRKKQEKALAERKKASAGEVYTGKGKGKIQTKMTNPKNTPAPSWWKVGSGKRKLKGAGFFDDYIKPAIRYLVENNLHFYATMLVTGAINGLLSSPGVPLLSHVLKLPQWFLTGIHYMGGAAMGIYIANYFDEYLRKLVAEHEEELIIIRDDYPPIPAGSETAVYRADIDDGMVLVDINDTARRFQHYFTPAEVTSLFEMANNNDTEPTHPLTNEIIVSLVPYIAHVNPVGQGRKMKGKAMPENLDFLQQIAKESYNLENPKEDINGWILKKWTPTLKFYMKGNDVIVGVRGTKPTDSEDVSADLTIPFNGIPSTNRYKRDKASMQQFQQQYPQSEYSYFAVGHSLGGAIIDTMIRQNLIKEAVSYNPAIQYSDINGGLPNRRIYYGSDPLYRLMGWWDRKSEHREPENPTWADWLGKISAPAAAVAALPAHGLSNFKGGKLGKKLVFT